jgi:lysophospholipase L1-like esterase
MMKMKRMAILTAALFAVTLLPPPISADAAAIPNPVISRNVPAYAGSNPATASTGNDEHYFSFWSAQCPDYLAYDLSGVPEENRQVIDAVWYNTSAYDVVGMYVNRNMEPSDYTIEVNAAPGGTYPESGWEVVETVADNTLASRQHIVEFAGYNWIRICLTQADDKENGMASINFDIHDVSQGISDSWLFLGDSITAGGMNNCYGTGFATYIHRLDESYFPIQENGGIGGITSKDGLEHIDTWLATFPGQYVSIAYGTNDAWGNQTGAEQYYQNTKSMLDKVLALGKTPVLPKIPHAEEAGVADHLGDYNAMIDRLWAEYPEVIQGPDFDAILTEHPEYLSGDGVHPNSEGYEEMRRIWAETMYERVYQAASPKAVKGDVSADGVLDVKDAVLLQKWILNIPGTTLARPDAADLDGDGQADSFDLALMKRILTEK